MKKIFSIFAMALGFAASAMALNPYAYGVQASLNADKTQLTATYSLNAAADSVKGILYLNGTPNGTLRLPAPFWTKGEHTINVPIADLMGANPAPGTYTVGVEVYGTSVASYEAASQYTTLYGIDHPQGVAVDTDPASPYFGRILTVECLESVNTKWTLSSGKAGLYALNPDFTPINAGNPYKGGNTFTQNYTGVAGTAYSPRKVRISEDGRIFLSSGANDKAILWEVDPANLNNWTEVIKGNVIDTANFVQMNVQGTDTTILGYANLGMDVKGKGNDLKVLMLGGTKGGIVDFAQSQYHMTEYPLGSATTFNAAPTVVTKLDAKYWIGTSINVCYDKRGGIWACQYRGTTIESQPGLVHLNANDSIDYFGYGSGYNNLRAGVVKYFNDSIIAISYDAKKVAFYKETFNADDAPVLTLLGVVACTSVGNNVNDVAFDYAGNMYAVGNSSEKIGAYALPYSGHVVTPVVGFEFVVEAPAATDYYIKNNWSAASDWTWEKMTAAEGNTYTYTGVYGGTGVNINTAQDDATAAWFGEEAAWGVQALDTVAFTYNATTNTLAVELVGRPVAPEVINYYLVGTASEGGWNAGAAMPLHGDSIVRHLVAGSYEFRLLSTLGQWDQKMGYAQINTECSSQGYTAGNDNNIKITLNADGDVKIKVVNNQICLTGAFGAAVITSYTIAGSAALLGVEWDAAAVANDMVENDGTWTLVLNNVELTAATYEYKVVGNHSWDVFAYPSANATLAIEAAGTYNVTFTWVPATPSLTAVAELVTPTAIEEVAAQEEVQKVFLNGTLYIRKAGVLYTTGGARVE